MDPTTGKLTPLGKVGVETQPRGFAIDPTGRLLVVSGEKSAEVGLYAVNAASSELRKRGIAPAGAGANWVKIVESR